jgi:hypothetical protein
MSDNESSPLQSSPSTAHRISTWIVDQISNEWASLSPSVGPSSALSFECPISLLPSGTKEGDCLRMHMTLDHETKQKLLDDLDEQIQRLTNDDDLDDFSI